MAIAALITWLLTAVGGFVMLGKWLAKGGQRSGSSHLPPAVMFSHFGLAAIGLVVWIIYVFTDNHALAWIGFVLLLPVAALGLVMFLRWLPTYQRARATSGGGSDTTASHPAERSFPVAVVFVHGILAVVTVILALLAALEY